MRERADMGFGLVEVVTTVMVGAILMGVALPIMTGALRRTDADGAAELLAQELAYARGLAVGSRNDVTVQLDPVQSTVIVAPASGSARGPFALRPGMRLLATAPVPDTPDALGGTVLGTGALTQITFRENGAAVL